MKEKVVSYLKGLKKEQWVVYLLLGALLLVIAIPVGTRNEGQDAEGTGGQEAVETAVERNADSQEELMEQRLEEVLEQVEGVGEVRVVLSLESTSQKIVEKDTPTSQSSQSDSSVDGTTSSETISREESTVYQRSSDGSETPYVVWETYPEVRGVLVVAQGGGNPVVVQQIQEAVMALFRVEAHKIKVMKMK